MGEIKEQINENRIGKGKYDKKDSIKDGPVNGRELRSSIKINISSNVVIKKINKV